MQQLLLQLAVQEMPTIIEGFKAAFVKQNPALPPPTDAQVIAALTSAYLSSLAKDDEILKRG